MSIRTTTNLLSNPPSFFMFRRHLIRVKRFIYSLLKIFWFKISSFVLISVFFLSISVILFNICSVNFELKRWRYSFNSFCSSSGFLLGFFLDFFIKSSRFFFKSASYNFKSFSSKFWRVSKSNVKGGSNISSLISFEVSFMFSRTSRYIFFMKSYTFESSGSFLRLLWIIQLRRLV